MKKRLSQYTIAQFIDIACGDYSCIVGTESDKKRMVAESLIAQYNEVSDPMSAKARLVDGEKSARNECKIALYRILLNLINVYDAYGDVREILDVMGYSNISSRDDEKMKSKLEQMLRSEEFLQKRMKEERDSNAVADITEEEIRKSFDEQTARLMAHFKFAIVHEKISASVYANLVNIACKQQRAQAANGKQATGK